jgi:hypothetical protein
MTTAWPNRRAEYKKPFLVSWHPWVAFLATKQIILKCIIGLYGTGKDRVVLNLLTEPTKKGQSSQWRLLLTGLTFGL